MMNINQVEPLFALLAQRLCQTSCNFIWDHQEKIESGDDIIDIVVSSYLTSLKAILMDFTKGEEAPRKNICELMDAIMGAISKVSSVKKLKVEKRKEKDATV